MEALPKDLKGLAFGFLIVQRRGEPVKKKETWWVRCSCGSPEKLVHDGNLRYGRTKSCGCATRRLIVAKLQKQKNLANQRFGRLVVLWRAGKKGHDALWECKCDCGKLTKVLSNNLRSGHTKSCGCLQHEGYLEPGQYGFNALLYKYQKSAETRGLVWALSEEQFKGLVTGSCFFCGQPPSQTSIGWSKKGQFTYNGIDRLENSAGYTPTNTVSCCGVHNKMKGTMSSKEFLTACEAVVKHNNRLQSAMGAR